MFQPDNGLKSLILFPLNILYMLATLPVFQLANGLKSLIWLSSNMLSMSVTLLVSKLAKPLISCKSCQEKALYQSLPSATIFWLSVLLNLGATPSTIKAFKVSLPISTCKFLSFLPALAKSAPFGTTICLERSPL